MSLEQVKELRQATGAGVVEAKRALDEANGDITAATKLLKQRGLNRAAGKAGRDTREGIVATYAHSNGKLVASVALACETDFVARTPEFQELGKELAMQVAAMNPLWVSPDEVPEAERLEREKEARAEAKGKPPAYRKKIVAGKLDKWYQEVCLLEQLAIRDDSQRVRDLVASAVTKLGENIAVVSFSRIAV